MKNHDILNPKKERNFILALENFFKDLFRLLCL